MRALLQNPSPAAAVARPASMSASALAADREQGAPKAPEQGFAHLLQDSQRRSAVDVPPPPPPPPPAAAKGSAPAARDTTAPAHDAPTPAPASEHDAAPEGGGKSSVDADAQAVDDAGSTAATDAAASKDKGRTRSTANRTSGRVADKAGSAPPPAGPEAEADAPKARGLAAAAADATPATPTAPVPTGLDAVLAQWQLATRKMAAGEGGKAEADAAATTGTPAGTGHTSSRADAAAEAALASPDLDRSARADLGAAISTAAFARTDEAAALTARPGFDKLLSRSLEAIVAPAATSSAATYGAGIEATATTTVNVPAAIDTPEFAPALAMQVSLLTSEGVQQAELHLNPAEMGPVSVQISLDGTQAHVSFGADLAATRQAIEAGLPDLAGALREAGFTLAGGGVSEHASGQRQPGSDSGPSSGSQRGDRSHADAAPIVATLRHVTRAGGIDLYA